MTAAPQPLVGLRQARAARGMGQTAAGRIIGRNQGHLSKIERGTVGLDVREALTLARALGVTVEQLVEGTTGHD